MVTLGTISVAGRTCWLQARMANMRVWPALWPIMVAKAWPTGPSTLPTRISGMASVNWPSLARTVASPDLKMILLKGIPFDGFGWGLIRGVGVLAWSGSAAITQGQRAQLVNGGHTYAGRRLAAVIMMIVTGRNDAGKYLAGLGAVPAQDDVEAGRQLRPFPPRRQEFHQQWLAPPGGDGVELESPVLRGLPTT